MQLMRVPVCVSRARFRRTCTRQGNLVTARTRAQTPSYSARDAAPDPVYPWAQGWSLLSRKIHPIQL